MKTQKFIAFLLVLATLSLLIVIIYSRLSEQQSTIWLRWAAHAAPVVLILFFVSFGFIGCGRIKKEGLNFQGLSYFHPDHLGSTRMVTDNNGAVQSRIYYTPYGEVIRDENRTVPEC